jgi:DNA polymerase-1
MLVSTENFQSILGSFTTFGSVDTETTGLNSFKDDKLFSIILSDENDDYYLNFHAYPEEDISPLPKELIKNLSPLFADENKIWFLQNAKFDMHMLAREGLFIAGKIYDTAVLDRVHYNQHMRYNLAEITKRWGDEKLDIVWKYIEENKLKTKTHYERFNKTIEQPHFDRVPFSIIQPYGEQDGRGTLNVGIKILNSLKLEDEKLDPRIPGQMKVVENESRLTKTLFNMEHRGIQLDIPYCNEALDYYQAITSRVEGEFKAQTGLDFVKGTTVFEEVFVSEKDKWEKTEKGNWKWDADVLESFENPIARLVIEWAEAKKQSEYFANFLYYADSLGVLHPDFQQGGTVTGRLSCRDPNLQNLTNPDKYEEETEASLYPVRRAFIPRPGHFFAMIDFSQMEFRMMLDYANANSLINEILKGHDVHTATANVSGTSRKEAKTTNFLTAYGGGVVKLAQGLFKGKLKGSKAQLGAIYKKMFGWRLSDEEQRAWPTVTEEQRALNEPYIRKAYDIQQSIFRAAPEVKDFLKAVQRAAETRGYVRNWLGRRYYFSDKRWAYKAPNHLIQGGSAEVTKIAMNRTDEYLKDKASKMLLSIHDELVIEVKYGEEHVVDAIKGIMENIYPYKRLPLLVDVEWSPKNLADKQDWTLENFSRVTETRNQISQQQSEAKA